MSSSFPSRITPRTTPGPAAGTAAAPPRAVDRYDAGRRAAAAAPAGSLMKPPGSLDPGSRAALAGLQGGTYGQTGRSLAPAMAGKSASEIETLASAEAARQGLPPAPITSSWPGPGGTTVQQKKWEYPDGTVVRVKETVPPGGMVDPFRRGPTYSVSVLKRNPATGAALPDSYPNEAFKLDAAGEPVPKSPAETDPRAMPADRIAAAGFKRGVGDRGHVQTRP